MTVGMYDKVEFFNNYFSRASEKELLVQALDKRFKPSSIPLKILDLGCHDGALMQKVLNQYQDRLPSQINLVGVDPSAPAIQNFLEKRFVENCSVSAFTGTSEKYFDQQNEYYDWVFASQCLYWSPDLLKIVQQISRAGKAGVIVLRGKRGVFQIQSHFRSLLGNLQEQLYTADDIERALISQGIIFQREDHTTFIKLPKLGSLEFKCLIAFFLQTDEHNLNDNVVSRVQDFATKESVDQMRHDVTFFWLGDALL